MRSIIANLPVAIREPENYEARSNLMWASTMAEIGIIKLGKQCDFEAHMIEHQMGAYTDCNHGMGLGVIHPAYYRRICRDGIKKFVKFAVNVWECHQMAAMRKNWHLAELTHYRRLFMRLVCRGRCGNWESQIRAC